MNEPLQLSIQDAFWLEMDKPNNLMVVDSLLWTATPIDWDRYRAVIKERLWDRYPAFRSVPERGRDGTWRWVERADADLEAHLHPVVLADPADDAALQDFIAYERTAPLARDRPLWRHFLVDGYRGGSAVVMRSHHALADGIRMVEIALSIGDATPDGGVPRPPRIHAHQEATHEAAPQPAHSAGPWALARTAVRNPVGGARFAGRAATAVAALPASVLAAATRHTGRAGRGMAAVLAAAPGDLDIVRKLVLGTRNDPTCWTGRVGWRKAVSWSSPIPLAKVKRVARAHDATVNDVLVTCVASSLRAYLQAHGASCASVTWDVPVNLKPLDAALPHELGNGFAIVQLELPTDIDDALVELEVVKARMARIKHGHEAPVAFAIQAGLSRLNKRLYRTLVDVLADRAVGVLTNVPGPQQPIYLAGQRIEGAMGWAPLSGDQAMSVTIYSYDGKVFVGIACDAGLLPDHQQIVDGFGAAFHRLVALSG